MNKESISNQVAGTAKKLAGGVESAYGKATNDKVAEAKGEAKKAVGQAQKKLGDLES